jgi:predicted metal-dependent hydrolase
VQLGLPWERPGPARGPHAVTAAGTIFPIDVKRHPRARRYVLRLADDGRLRLTVPRFASIREGLRFAVGQTSWIEAEWRRRRARLAPWTEGTVLWFRGERVPLERRGGVVRCGGVALASANGAADLRHVVETALRAMASAELTVRCRDLAAATGLQPSDVRVRNQKSRWGACSPRGLLTLNWRLIQMPSAVSDYVIYHELAHLRQPNHSRRFWREVAALCPGWREAERWLRRYGKEIL